MLQKVVAGIIQRKDRSLLLSERRQGTHLAGLLEFPGGKIEAQESPFSALRRELSEELGITVNTARPLITIRWRYPGLYLQIAFWRVTDYAGAAQGQEGQRLQWLPLAAIKAAQLPATNAAVLTALSLPDQYAITPSKATGTEAFLQRAEYLMRISRVRMLQLRTKSSAPDELVWLATQLQPLCLRYGASLLINGAVAIARRFPYVGVQLTASQLHQYRSRPLPPDRRVGRFMP